MREIEFRASITEEQWQRLRPSKPSAGLVSGILALTLVWVFSGISLGPPQLDFGELAINSDTRLPVRLTNRGVTEFHAASFAVEGDSGDFRMDAQRCAIVAAGESCVVWVEFHPREPGLKLARLTVRTKEGTELSSNFTGRAKAGSPQQVSGPESPTALPPSSGDNPPEIQTPHSDPPNAVTRTPDTPPQKAPDDEEAPPLPPHATQSNPDYGRPPSPIPDPPMPPIVITRADPPPVPRRQLPPPPPPPPAPPPPQPAPPPLVPQIRVQPGALDFSQPTLAAPQVIVSNPGTGTLALQFAVVGDDRASFSYAPGTCGPKLTPNSQCAVTVAYVPNVDQQSRQLNAVLVVNHNARNASSPQQVALTWKPTRHETPPGRPHVTVSPGSLQFNVPPPGSEVFSPTGKTFTVMNDGTASLTKLNLRLRSGGSNGTPFTQTSQCPTVLDPGQRCNVQVNYFPHGFQGYSDQVGVFESSTPMAAVGLQATVYSTPLPPKNPGGFTSGVYVPPGKVSAGAQSAAPPTGLANHNTQSQANTGAQAGKTGIFRGSGAQTDAAMKTRQPSPPPPPKTQLILVPQQQVRKARPKPPPEPPR